MNKLTFFLILFSSVFFTGLGHTEQREPPRFTCMRIGGGSRCYTTPTECSMVRVAMAGSNIPISVCVAERTAYCYTATPQHRESYMANTPITACSLTMPHCREMRAGYQSDTHARNDWTGIGPCIRTQ